MSGALCPAEGLAWAACPENWPESGGRSDAQSGIGHQGNSRLLLGTEMGLQSQVLGCSLPLASRHGHHLQRIFKDVNMMISSRSAYQGTHVQAMAAHQTVEILTQEVQTQQCGGFPPPHPLWPVPSSQTWLINVMNYDKCVWRLWFADSWYKQRLWPRIPMRTLHTHTHAHTHTHTTTPPKIACNWVFNSVTFPSVLEHDKKWLLLLGIKGRVGNMLLLIFCFYYKAFFS